MAASVQKVYEDELNRIVKKHCKKINLVLSGGCALNCVANSNLKRNIWIMPNPGDSGSSLGCIPAVTKQRLNWKGPFLGYNIRGEYPVDSIIKELETNKMVGVANGRAEFGPRALGNRSLLADPRGPEVKDMVNEIKKRQKFRPFAPAILLEDVHDYFDMLQKLHICSLLVNVNIKEFLVSYMQTAQVEYKQLQKKITRFYNLLKT